MNATREDVVLDVRDLHTYFFNRRSTLKAVDGVTFSLRRGETLGLVGESGCGKSMTALSLLRLVPQPAARIVSGEILLDGNDLLRKTPQEMRLIRGRHIAMILQDPQTSLNPVFTIGNQLMEAFAVHRRQPLRALRQLAEQVLGRVRVAAPTRRLEDFPHQMSGGMKQRVVGAIAIAGSPQVLIADEPTTALDVTIQLQYLKLLKEIQANTQMALLFITHDFGIVARMCDRVAVMYAGRIVEQGPVRQVFRQPAHPYTQALMASVPKMEEKADFLTAIEGQPPALDKLPPGCRFAPRCAYAESRCSQEYPSLYTIETDHTASCWRLEAK
ncbi:ABC transporter ATP-binding protein [Candidatus Entotheonella palauensis]|uniref:ABC transporter ATP-binding protein n=1 Tax=Candidatus Entotheonella palauensis TaxID=93172 RepID=UPI000B7FFBC0|nr:ABC transporter ATP-binding protein [Candidatus Entotheonella palauensis]